MPELLVDFITSLDGYGAADGWPGWWGLEGPEYLAWLGEQPEADFTVLMGATTYRLMYGFASRGEPRYRSAGGHVEGRVLQHLDRPAGVGELDSGHPGPGRGSARDEGHGHHVHADHGQPHPVPLAAERRARGSFPRGRLPGHHRKHRSGPDLRRVPRRRARDGRAAAPSTVGCSCSSTGPRYWQDRPARKVRSVMPNASHAARLA